MCEVAQRFAGWLGLGPGVEAALEYVFARWDGRGFPDVGGDAIPLPVRLLHVARDFSLFLSAAGPDDACGVIERRAGERVRAAARRARPAGLRRARSPGSTRRGCGSRHSKASRFRRFDFGRPDRCRLRRHRRDDGPQVTVAARALDASGRARRGGGLAYAPPGRRRYGPTPRRARARPRPRRRVERDLGEARAARIRRVGARPSAPALHRARVRTIADARSDRAPRGLSSRAARRFRVPPRRERLGARPGRARPRCRGLLLGHVRGEAAPTGARGRRPRRS